MSCRVVLGYGVAISLMLSFAACGRSEPAASPAPAQPAQPAAAPAAAVVPPAAATPAAPAPAAAVITPAAAPIASATYSADPNLRCDLMEIRRVSGGAVLVKWRIVNTAGSAQAGGLAAPGGSSVNYNFGWQELYYVDPAENKKYSFLTDSEGERILSVYWGDLPAGQQRENWAKFPAPPLTSTKISLALPKFPPFEDVPVAQ